MRQQRLHLLSLTAMAAVLACRCVLAQIEGE